MQAILGKGGLRWGDQAPRGEYWLNTLLLCIRTVKGEAQRRGREVPFAGCGWADQGGTRREKLC